MKTLTLLILAGASFAAAPALAQQSHTATFDTPRYEGTRTVEYSDGTLTRDTDVTRKRDGATAESTFERQRTETGVTRDRATTHFDGSTSSTHYARHRTPHGWAATGEHVGRNGNVVRYHARTWRGPHGAVHRRVVRRR